MLPRESPLKPLNGGVVGYFRHGYHGYNHPPVNNLRVEEASELTPTRGLPFSPWEGAISRWLPVSRSSGCGPRSPRRPGSWESPRPWPPMPPLRRRYVAPRAGAAQPPPPGADCAKLLRDAGTMVMPANLRERDGSNRVGIHPGPKG